MLQNLYNVYSRLVRPSSLFWLNLWSYSTNNTWVFLSNELLSFYIESIRGFRTVSVKTFQLHPNSIFRLVILSIVLVQFGLFIG